MNKDQKEGWFTCFGCLTGIAIITGVFIVFGWIWGSVSIVLLIVLVFSICAILEAQEKKLEEASEPVVVAEKETEVSDLDYSFDRLEESFEIRLSRGINLPIVPSGEVSFKMGELVSGKLSIWHDKDDFFIKWRAEHSEEDRSFSGAVETLKVRAEIEKEDQHYLYDGYIECCNLYFNEGQEVASKSELEWTRKPSLYDMFDTRDNISIRLDGEEHTVREKYMPLCCSLMLKGNVLKIRNSLLDIYNGGEWLNVYYDLPIESILFLNKPKVHKYDGEVEEIDLQGGKFPGLTIKD